MSSEEKKHEHHTKNYQKHAHAMFYKWAGSCLFGRNILLVIDISVKVVGYVHHRIEQLLMVCVSINRTGQGLKRLVTRATF